MKSSRYKFRHKVLDYNGIYWSGRASGSGGDKEQPADEYRRVVGG